MYVWCVMLPKKESYWIEYSTLRTSTEARLASEWSTNSWACVQRVYSIVQLGPNLVPHLLCRVAILKLSRTFCSAINSFNPILHGVGIMLPKWVLNISLILVDMADQNILWYSFIAWLYCPVIYWHTVQVNWHWLYIGIMVIKDINYFWQIFKITTEVCNVAIAISFPTIIFMWSYFVLCVTLSYL